MTGAAEKVLEQEPAGEKAGDNLASDKLPC